MHYDSFDDAIAAQEESDRDLDTKTAIPNWLGWSMWFVCCVLIPGTLTTWISLYCTGCFNSSVHARPINYEISEYIPIKWDGEATGLMYELRDINIKDGDTLSGTILVGFEIELVKQDMRARDYDAWESHRYRRSAAVGDGITDVEIAKGKLATQKLVEWVGNKSVFVQCKPERDTYGRWLVSFYRINDDGTFTNFATWMKRNGHTRPTSP